MFYQDMVRDSVFVNDVTTTSALSRDMKQAFSIMG